MFWVKFASRIALAGNLIFWQKHYHKWSIIVSIKHPSREECLPCFENDIGVGRDATTGCLYKHSVFCRLTDARIWLLSLRCYVTIKCYTRFFWHSVFDICFNTGFSSNFKNFRKIDIRHQHALTQHELIHGMLLWTKSLSMTSVSDDKI